MGNEMGNSNVSGLQEQENNELQANNNSAETSMQSNAADGVEDKLSDVQTAAEGFNERIKETASAHLSEPGDHQIREQTLTEKEKENGKLHPPNKSSETLMPSNDEDGDENLSAFPPEEEDFLEKPVKTSEIGATDQKLSSLTSEAEDFHQKPVRASKIGDQQSENQTLREVEEIKTSKQTYTSCETISMESINQKTIEQESIASSAESCENRNNDNVIESDGPGDSIQKGDTTEILDECIDPHSDVEVLKNLKNMLMEETEKHKRGVEDKICKSVYIVQSGDLENGHEEQKTELNLARNDSTKLPSISSRKFSSEEAIETEIKTLCLKHHIAVIEKGCEIESNEYDQDPTLISEKGKESVDKSETKENGEEAALGDKKEDCKNGFCCSRIGRGVAVDKGNEIDNRLEIEMHKRSLSSAIEEHKDLEKDEEMIYVDTSLAENDTETTHEEIMEFINDESFEEPILLECDETKGMEITNHSLSSLYSFQKDVDIIELTTRKKEDYESLGKAVEETINQTDRESDSQMKEYELKTISITEEQKSMIEVAESILIQSDPTQKNTIMEGETAEPIIIQSEVIQKERIVEGKNAESRLAQSDTMRQETISFEEYLVSQDHAQEPEHELNLLKFGRAITDSEEENCTKVYHAKSFDADSSNPTVDTAVLATKFEDLMSQASIQVVEISSCESGELFVLSMHQTNEQEQKCNIMALEGVHNPSMASDMLENSDSFSFDFEKPFAEAQALELQSKKEQFKRSPSLHLQTEFGKGVASESEKGHSEPDIKNINVPTEVIKTDDSTLEVKIEKSEICTLQQQPNADFFTKIQKPVAENNVSVLKASKEEPTETKTLLLETSAGTEAFSLERSDSRKFRNPIQRILKEEICVSESQKHESTVLKETVHETGKSTDKVTSTSPGEKKKHKLRYALFGNCMCCTTVIQ